jgi:hypothetical protein
VADLRSPVVMDQRSKALTQVASREDRWLAQLARKGPCASLAALVASVDHAVQNRREVIHARPKHPPIFEHHRLIDVDQVQMSVWAL